MIVKRAYCNSASLNRSLQEEITDSGMGIVDVSDVKAPDLNMQVVVDAVETAISKPLIKRFIFVTEDINFGPLMLKLRQLGCSTTIMVMSEHIGDKLKPCVDEVVLLNAML